ncbi:MAG TPA: hypothetical protein VFV71_01795 [Burkholderiales bacterium]|nr:hypothetical protein [Burkholderiales bacterium]
MRLPAPLLLLALLPATALAADACAYLSQSDAAALTGQPVTNVDAAPARRDEDSGGQLNYCTYRSAGSAAVVSVVEFPSEVAARKQLSAAMVRGRMDNDGARVTEESGIGEKAYYGISTQGSMIVFVKNNKVVAIGAGGTKPAPKEALRKVALAVAGKL